MYQELNCYSVYIQGKGCLPVAGYCILSSVADLPLYVSTWLVAFSDFLWPSQVEDPVSWPGSLGCF